MPDRREASSRIKPVVPAYMLYGEAETGTFPDSVHAETIHARSSTLQWRIEPHRHHGLYQALWISGGGARLRVEEETLQLATPGFVWIPPLVVHGFHFERGTTGIVVSIPAPTLARAFPKASGLRADLDRTIIPGPSLSMPDLGEAAFLFETLLAEYGTSRPGRDESLAARGALLAVWFARTGEERSAAIPSIDADIVQRFLSEVENSYTEHRPLPDYARALGVSAPHLGRICRQFTGHSALKLLHERIVIEAKRHLVYTELPVCTIALRLGFEDAAYFSRFFRERAGQSPQAFRRSSECQGET